MEEKKTVLIASKKQLYNELALILNKQLYDDQAISLSLFKQVEEQLQKVILQEHHLEVEE